MHKLGIMQKLTCAKRYESAAKRAILFFYAKCIWWVKCKK